MKYRYIISNNPHSFHLSSQDFLLPRFWTFFLLYSLLYSTDFLFPKIKCLILDTIGLLWSVLVRHILRIIRKLMPSNLSTVFIQGQCHSSLCHAAILIISPPLQVLHFKQNIREKSRMQSVQQRSRNRKVQAWLFNCHHNTGNVRQHNRVQ